VRPIIGVLKEGEAGRRAVPAPRDQHGDILHLAKEVKYCGMDASEAKRLRELEAENARLKRIVADQVFDMSAMKELLEKNW
jgi:putative transposase